jgi:hypothetical protein
MLITDLWGKARVYYLVCDSAGENVGEKGKGEKERKTSVTTGL